MTAHEFGLTFATPEVTDLDALIERLGDAGCDDATVGVGRRGRVALSFTREAGSAAEAVLSAIGAVREAIPGARLVEASPDLIGLTDVAALLGVSRQNARKLLLGCAAPPPPPVHEGRPTLWRLAKVLRWLREAKGYRVADDLADLAETTMQVNLAVESGDAERSVQRKILALLT